VRELLFNTLTPHTPTAATIGLLATVDSTGAGCNPSTVTAADMVEGLRAWRATIHTAPANTYQVTESPFQFAQLGDDEMKKITGFCTFIFSTAQDYGRCHPCRNGAQDAFF